MNQRIALRRTTSVGEPKIMRRTVGRQMELRPRTRGGRREGAGRKPLPEGKRRVSHLARERFAQTTPAHVTLRMAPHVWNLRSARSFRRLLRAFDAHRGRHPLRLIEFSVQGNHLHLIVEAESNEALSRGMQGLCIRIARALNAMMGRHGRVFADHYHARLLRTPTELVRAIAYALRNAADHFGARQPAQKTLAVARESDRFASDALAAGVCARTLGPRGPGSSGSAGSAPAGRTANRERLPKHDLSFDLSRRRWSIRWGRRAGARRGIRGGRFSTPS